MPDEATPCSRAKRDGKWASRLRTLLCEDIQVYPQQGSTAEKKHRYKRQHLQASHRVCILAWNPSLSEANPQSPLSQEWQSGGRSHCRRANLQDCQQVVRCWTEFSQNRRWPAKKTLALNKASVVFSFSQWLQALLWSLSVCSSLHNQTSSHTWPQKYACLNIATEALTHIDHWAHGNTVAGYSQGHNGFYHFTDFEGIKRGARRRTLLTHQSPVHNSTQARTHREMFHLSSETFLVPFKANIILSCYWSSNSAGTPLVRTGKEEPDAKVQEQEEPFSSSGAPHHSPEGPEWATSGLAHC